MSEMTPEAQKRFIQSQSENAEWWEENSRMHLERSRQALEHAKQCRDDVAFFTARLEREAAKENG